MSRDELPRSLVTEEMRHIADEFSKNLVADIERPKQKAQSVEYFNQFTGKETNLAYALSYLSSEYTRVSSHARSFARDFEEARDSESRSHYRLTYIDCDISLHRITDALVQAIHYAKGLNLLEGSAGQDIENMKSQITKLETENTQLKDELAKLKSENEDLQQKYEILDRLNKGRFQSDVQGG